MLAARSVPDDEVEEERGRIQRREVAANNLSWLAMDGWLVVPMLALGVLGVLVWLVRRLVRR